jgi:calcium-translocating P-type ATPase
MTVVAAPEGLPMMITVVLSANMKRMIVDNILVKKLVGIETAGSMNILFTDKTGTLTVGRPECEKFIYSFGCSDNLSSLKNAGAVYEALVQSAKYNTDIVEMGKDTGGGNTTERAIYDFFKDCKCSVHKVKEKTSFSSERKFSSATLENGKTLIKGAAEVIIAASKYALTKNGDMIVFDKDAIMAEYYDSVNRGERVVGVAISEKGLKDLCFVALITMRDKIRAGVVDSVRRVKSAGIQVVMITGDGGETAKRIAVECGIFSQRDGHISLSSDDLRKMSDAEIKAILAKLRVVYRALPGDKTRLVRLSQELDLVVGMTGDGINDSPSLKLADVGFAMGSGTDIAKSAADIVILDDSFLAISKTVLYGRTIFKSIRKFITFQLTMNLAACGVSLLGQFIGIETPITIIQMLWVNIIMDTLGGLAFAGEPPLEYFMKEKTKSRSEHILSKDMINQIACTGLYTLAVCILFLTSPVIRIMFGGVQPTEKFYTAFYVLFIFSGLFNCFLARCSRLWLFSNISQNKAFILIMFLIAAIQICMVYFGGSVFRCVPLQPHELSFVILMASSLVPFEMVRRLIYKLK